VSPIFVAVGIAIVLVAGGGKLALPAASGDPAPAADLSPAVLEPIEVGTAALPPSAAPAPAVPMTAPTVAPVPRSSATAASRSVARKPVAKATPRPTPKPTAVKPTVVKRTQPKKTVAAPVRSGDPRSIARSMLAARGQSGQFSCLDSLWTRESGWRTTAANPSGAYGIPQALPGSKMASAGSDWRTNPATQITWGLNYISSRYGSPCAAWSYSRSHGSY
jgi:hypothetical protein